MASISGDFGTNLSAHWKMEETSGTRYDETANNNDLTENGTGGVGYSASGKLGNAADNEQADNDYLSIAHGSQTGLSSSGSFSTSFWIKPESVETTGQVRYYMGKGGEASGVASWTIFSQEGTYTGLQTSSDGTNGTRSNAFVAWVPTAGNWYHLVCVYDAPNSDFLLYVNGSQQGTTQNTTNTSLYQSTANPFTIGFLTGASSTRSYDGLIDEVSYWNGRIISSSEVTTLYNSGTPLPYAPTTSVKTHNGLAVASVKTVDGLAIASVKTSKGLA